MRVWLALVILFGFVGAVVGEEAEQWAVWERAFDGPSAGNPYIDVTFSARFTRGQQRLTIPGFYDGHGSYRLRFMPPAAGTWKYTTRSNSAALRGKTGRLSVGPAAAGNHGPMRVFQTYYLRYADGTPYHEFGTTCYAWVHQTQQLQEQTLKTLATAPFNKIRFCVFPKSYTYNKNEPDLFAFRKKADGTFDF